MIFLQGATVYIKTPWYRYRRADTLREYINKPWYRDTGDTKYINKPICIYIYIQGDTEYINKLGINTGEYRIH